MILIDLIKPVQQLVFSTNLFNDAKSFLLKITSDSDNTQHLINLSGNLSFDFQRNFLFEVDTELFNGFTSGFYHYSILLSDTNEVATVGKLYIKALPKDNEYFEPESDDNDNEFLIYNG